MTELMHAAHPRGHDPFFEHAMTCKFGRIGDDRVVADVAIVGDVRIIHHEHAAADLRQHAAALGAAMDGRKFANSIIVADHQTRRFAVILQVLRCRPDRGELENLVARADNGRAFDNSVRPYGGFRSDSYFGTDYSARADRDGRVEFRASVNYGAGMNTAGYGICSCTSIAVISASAAKSDSTRASARIFHNG
jgi:hypothetical protein